MKAVAGILIALATIVLPAVVAAQAPVANASNVHPSATNVPASGAAPVNVEPGRTGQIFPLIEMDDVPISTAIQRLAMDASINYMTAPSVVRKWVESGEPKINFKVKNAVANDVLIQMLNLHHLALAEDPVSNIALIIPAGEITNPLFAGLATNTASPHTNIIPLIQFVDVPITSAIENLARQDDVNYMLDPNVTRLWDGSSPADYVPEPLISVHLQNVTAWNTLNRLLNIHNLILEENQVTHIAHIVFSNEPLPIMDASLLDAETNNSPSHADELLPLIQFTSVPLDTALENLIRQCNMNIKLAPQLDDESYWQGQSPYLSARWTNVTAWQAMVAICENYDLVFAKDDTTGLIQIKPREITRHHHLQLK